MCTQKVAVMSDVYSVAFRFEVGCGNERVVGFCGDFTRVPPHVGLFKRIPYLLTVISEKHKTSLDQPHSGGKK